MWSVVRVLQPAVVSNYNENFVSREPANYGIMRGYRNSALSCDKNYGSRNCYK